MRRVFIPQSLQTLPEQLPIGEQFTLSGQSMGTTWTVNYINSPQLSEGAVRELIECELNVVIAQMSTWELDSNICTFNRADANTWHALPTPFFTVLRSALTIAERTQGAFDPTIGTLINLWGFGPEGKRTSPPSSDEVEVLHANCGWQKLQLDQDEQRALQPGKIHLDFSGIAKGYAVDRIAQALEQAGLMHYLIEVGGELYGAGIKANGQPWWTLLETSPEAITNTESIVALHGLAVATSGDYLRYFNYRGQHYAHTLDPRTGYPINHANTLVSVTVMHAECMIADALATAFNVMGASVALTYAKENDIVALFIERTIDGYQEHLSPKLVAMLE